MATVSVFTCPTGQQYTATDSYGNTYASCTVGQGVWEQVTLEEPFDPSTLNSAELSGSFFSGFIVLGTGLAIVWAARQVINAIRVALR